MTPETPRPSPSPARAGSGPGAGAAPGAGTRAAEGERLAVHGQRLRLLLVHLAGGAVRRRVELDDLVQEVYLRALSSPRGLPDDAPDEPEGAALWRLLAHLARHAVIDAARAIRAAKRSGPTVPLARSDWSRPGPRASQLASEEAGPLTRLAGREAAERLRARFEQLSPEHRRVIGLRQFEGRSARETARRMGRSESAVHSLYRRALEAWRAGVDDEKGGTRDESDR